MNKKFTPTTISNLVIIFLSAVCLILSFQFVLPSVNNEKTRSLSEGWTYQIRSMAQPKSVSLPTSSIPNPSGSEIVLKRALPDDYIPGATLMFTTAHQTLEVFVDDIRIYSFGIKMSSPFGKSFGNAWHTVRLPNDYMSKEIVVKLRSPHAKYAGFVDNVTFGTKSSHILSLITKNASSAFIGATLFVFGLIIKIVYFAISRRSKKSPVILYLSSFATFCGLWILSESKILQLILNVPLAITFATMLSLLLMPIPLLYFFNSNYIFGERRAFKILIFIHRTIAIASIIMHLVHLVDFIYIIPILHILFIVDLTIALFFCITNIHKKVVRVMLFGLAALYISMILNAVLYYVSANVSVTLFSKWGMLVFVAVVGVDAGKHILSMSKTNVMNSALAQLAYNDTLTGLKNRAAFQEQLNNYETHPEDLATVSIALADLNFLKKINDTYGHKKGDAIIIQCANLLSANFGKIGSVYRIGGDEFVVIIPNAPPAQCNEAYANFKRAVKLYNKTIPTGELLSVALGLAHFNRAYDKTVNDLFNRADSAMYTNKVAIKEKIAAKANETTKTVH